MPAPVAVSLIPQDRVPQVLTRAATDRLRAAGWRVDVRPLPPRASTADLVACIGAEAAAVITTWGCPAFTPDVHATLPALRFIGYCAGSVKHLVGEETFARGVTVCSAAPVIATAVGEYCLAMALWSLRGLGAISAGMAAQPGPEGWRRSKETPARSLWGRSVGIISASSTGRVFMELLRPFGCDIAVYDPYLTADEARVLGVRRAALEEVCGQSVVSCHAPNLPATAGLVGRDQLARIPDGGLFINSSRPAVVDYDALYAELQAGRFRAVLDVFPKEALPADSPFFGLPAGILLTPHVAGYSVDVYERMGDGIVDDLLRWQAGDRPVLAVDARRWALLA